MIANKKVQISGSIMGHNIENKINAISILNTPHYNT